MPHFNHSQHDIGITRQDGTQVGLMLVKQKDDEGNDVPVYRTIYDSYLVNQFTTTPNFGATNPQEEIHIVGDSWREGFGLYIATDGERYFSSIGCDLRFKDMVIAGPDPQTVTKPAGVSTTASLTNKDFELDANWTGGARSTGPGGTAHGGTYSWQCTSAQTATQAADTWTNSWRSNPFVFLCWVHSAAASKTRIAIYDGMGTTYSDYHTGGSTWEYLSVTRTLDSSATELTCQLLQGAVGSDGFFDDCYIGSPVTGAVVASADFNSNLYAAQGNMLIKLDSDGDAFNVVTSFSTAITDLEPFTDNKLYIAQDTGNAYWQMDTAEVLLLNTLSGGNTMQYMKTVHGASPNMWGNNAVNKITSTTNPAVGGTDWAGATTVGSSFYSITGMTVLGGLLHIGKEDQPYYLNSSNQVQSDIGQELTSLATSTAGKNAFPWKNKLYYPFGTQGLLEIDESTSPITTRVLSPASFTTNNSDFVGRVQAVAGDDEYLYIAVDNSTKVEILAGRDEAVSGTTDWRWHPIAELTLAGVETMFVSSVVDKRLWISSTDATDSLYYIKLYTQYGDVTNDSQRFFQTDGEFITSFYHADFKGTDKAWISVTADLSHSPDSDIYYECHYQKLGDSVWTDAGDLIATSTLRNPTLFFPADSDTNNPVSTMFRLKFVAKTDTDTKTPVMTNFDIKAILRATARNVIECAIRASDGVLTKTGDELQGTNAAYIRATIEEMQDATWPVTIFDINGDTQTVNLMPREPFSDVVMSRANENLEEIFYLRLQIVDLA